MSKIVVVTTRMLIERVAVRWRNQYPFSAGRGSKDGARDIYLKLCELRPGASVEQVEAIIGNNTWTSEYCEECGQMVEGVAVLGSCDSECRARICLDCLKKAVTALETELQKGS
jgi:hypothetical protein